MYCLKSQLYGYQPLFLRLVTLSEKAGLPDFGGRCPGGGWKDYNVNNQKVSYQLNKPEGVPDEMLTEIPLNRQNEFMGMLMSMVDTKRSEGTINVDFKFEKLTDMISPKKVVFSSENATHKGNDITNIMVYKARNLMSDGSMFEPIYKTQVTTYIERVMRHGTGDFKEDSIVQFFSNNPNSQKSQWLSKREYLNALLGKGDDIEYLIDEESGFCTLNITFNGNVKNLEVEINRLSANKA